MNALLSWMWFFIGIIWSIAAKPFIEVVLCFLVCGIFSGAAELAEIRREMSAKELKRIIYGGNAKGGEDK